jgi:hypothetical protein
VIVGLYVSGQRESNTRRLTAALILASMLAAVLLGTPPAAAVSAAAADTAGPANAYGISAGGGLQFLSAEDRDRTLDDMVALGVTRVRFDMNWADIQRDGRGTYDWDRYDALVDAMVARGLEPLAIIAYTPPWARPEGCSDDDKCAPARLRDYSQFAFTAALRYESRGVNDWEIWNEPNIVNFWRPAPDAARYAEMLQLAYRAIKRIDRDAFVLTGGTAPAADNGTNIAPRTFLSTLYEAGAGDSFDAVSHHPYCFPAAAPGEYYEWCAWSQMADTSPSMRSIMVDNGDAAKKIWMTEYGAPTEGWGGVGEETQAEWVTEAYDLAASYDWAGPLFWYNHRDAPDNVHDSFGLRRADWTPKLSWDAYAESSP